MQKNTKIEGKLIRLLPLGLEYLDPYLEMLNDPLVHATTDPSVEPKDWTKQEIINWLTEIREKPMRMDFAIIEKSSNEFVGEVVLNDVKGREANIRIALRSRFFDKGYGTEAMKLAIKHAFETEGIELIGLGVYDVNPRGIHVYTKLGFKELSRLEEDGVIDISMQLKKQDFNF